MTEWQNAAKADGKFISGYAKEKPKSEDVAESLVAWMSLKCSRDRQDITDMNTIQKRIPNRLKYFDRKLRLMC